MDSDKMGIPMWWALLTRTPIPFQYTDNCPLTLGGMEDVSDMLGPSYGVKQRGSHVAPEIVILLLTRETDQTGVIKFPHNLIAKAGLTQKHKKKPLIKV